MWGTVPSGVIEETCSGTAFQKDSEQTESFAGAVALPWKGPVPPWNHELFEKWIFYSFNVIILNRKSSGA